MCSSAEDGSAPRLLEGPWEFVPPTSLPKDFAQIPDSSPKENVKAAVPGTRQAQEALVSNQIPTTARVDRNSTKFTLQTDGEPKLVPITGTTLQYVLNASTPVIRVDDKSWYACQDGVWFVAASMNGPWQVADSVPAVIYSIPPASPLYYVTYVRVYQATPTYVYVGYTPGYMGAVVAPGGVVVYGTGYYCSPWVGHYWYGCPVTYGMGVGMAWTPWTGWAFGFGYGWPYYGPVWYRPPAPWWGPYYGYGYYPYGGMTAWGPGGWATTSGNIYGHRGGFSTVQRGATGYNAFTGNQWATRYGSAYNSTTGTLITGQKGAVKNVYTGNYAYGKSGTATNTKTGASVTGGKVTVGNAYTGSSTTVGANSGSTAGRTDSLRGRRERRQRWSHRSRRARRQAGLRHQRRRSVQALGQRPVGAGHASEWRRQGDCLFGWKPARDAVATTRSEQSTQRPERNCPEAARRGQSWGTCKIWSGNGRHRIAATCAPTAIRTHGRPGASTAAVAVAARAAGGAVDTRRSEDLGR